jgi:hypothetical protein
MIKEIKLMGRTITNEMAELMMDMATFTYVNAMKELGVPKEEIMDMVPSIESAVKENFVKFCKVEDITEVVGDFTVEEN